MFDLLTLPNGLTIIGEKLSHFRSVSIGVWIAAGSQHEDAPEGGLSHFLEHMLFKGTEKRTARQIAEEVDSVGGQINAFTAKECTCFYAKVIDQHTELALDVLSDIVLNSTLIPDELEKEKGVILEEISMVEDEPEDLAHELIMLAHYGDQPLARPILGSSGNVRSFGRADLDGYRSRMYRPNNAVLAIAGNYDWDSFVKMAEKYLGGWERGPGSGKILCATAHSPSLIRREKDIEQLHICISFPGYAQGGAEVYPMTVFSSVLGGAMSSRLFQKIREERGMAYTVYSYPSFYTGTGMLTIYAGTSSAHADEVIRLIREEVDSMVASGITRDEFEKTREQIKGNLVLGQESSSARMNSLGRRMLLLGNTQTEDEIIAKIDAMNHDDVNKIIGEVLAGESAASLVGRGAGALDMRAFIR